MKTRPIIYKTREGEGVTIPPLSPEADQFLERVEAAVTVEAMDGVAMVELVWGTENPLLERNPANPGLPFATRETYDHPAFQRMLQLIDRKREILGNLDFAAVEPRYIVTVPEAAQILGIHETSVRQAIRGHRLAGIKKGTTYFLDPASVESYRVSTRGKEAKVQETEHAKVGFLPGALHIREGAAGNYTLQVKSTGGLAKAGNRKFGKASSVWENVLPAGWKQVYVLTGKKQESKYRLFILEPGKPDPEKDMGLSFAGFHVRGEFEVVSHENNPRKALEEWKGFKGA